MATLARRGLGTCRGRLDTRNGCPQGPQTRRLRVLADEDRRGRDRDGSATAVGVLTGHFYSGRNRTFLKWVDTNVRKACICSSGTLE